jgi:hypothetical protein
MQSFSQRVQKFSFPTIVLQRLHHRANAVSASVGTALIFIDFHSLLGRLAAAINLRSVAKKGGLSVRNSFNVSILAVLVAAILAVPAAFADSVTITDTIASGGMQIGTATLTQGGTCGTTSIASTSVCVDIQMTSGSVRLGGPVIGFSGNVNENGMTSTLTDLGGVSLSSGACGGISKETICFDANGPSTAQSLFLVLTNADTSSGITLGNIHVAGSFCAPSATCFATTTEVSTVPETGSLSLVGTGLIGLAALVRRRLST